MTMDGDPSGVLLRGQDIMLEMLRQVQGYFRTNDPSKKTEGWRNLDRAAMTAICSSRISHILDSEDDPAMLTGTDNEEDNQGQQVLEHAVIQEILLGLVEKRLHTTQLQVTQGPVDVQFLKQQFVTMARDSEHELSVSNNNSDDVRDAKVLAFWALDDLDKQSSVSHLRDTIRSQDATIQAMLRELNALRTGSYGSNDRQMSLTGDNDDSVGTIGKFNWSPTSSTYGDDDQPHTSHHRNVDASIEELRSSVHANYRDNVDMLHEHIQHLETQLQDAARHVADVTKLNHQLKLQVAQQVAPSNGNNATGYVDAMSGLQRQVQDLEVALDAATAHSRALESELAVPSANLAYLSRQNALLQQRVVIYKKELDDQVAGQQLLHKHVNAEGLEHSTECHHRFDGVCNDLIESLRAEILHGRDLHRSDLIDLLDQLSDLARENHALRESGSVEPGQSSPTKAIDDTLERVARNLHAENGQLAEQLRSYEATIAATDGQMAQLRQEREAQEVEVDLLLQKLNPMVAAHEAVMEERKAMEADLARREQTIQALQTNVYEMKREIKIISADVDAIVEEKEIMQEELDELRKRPVVHESLEAAEAETRPLRRSVSMKDQTIQETKARVAELERRLNNDKSEYAKAVVERDHAIEALQKKVFEYKREVNVLTDDLDSIYEEKHEVEQKLDQVETQLVNAQEELAELDRVVAELRIDVDRWREAYELARMQHEEERQHVMRWDAVVRAQLESMQGTSQEWAATQSETRAKYDSDVANLKGQVLSLQDSLALLTTSEEMLMKQLQDMAAAKATIESDKSSLESQFAVLEGQHRAKEAAWSVELRDLQRLHDDAVTSWDATWQSTVQAHDAAISVERDEKAAVVADLQRTMDELNASRLALSDDVDRLRLEKQAEVDGLKATRDEFLAQSDELAAEVAKWKAVVDALTLEKSTALERVETLEQHLDESLRQCAQFEAEMERHQKEFVEGRNHLNATVAALTESEQRLQQNVDELSNAKAVADDRVTDLQRQLDAATESYNVLHGEAAAHVADKTALRDNVESLQQLSEQLQAAHDAVEAQLTHSDSVCKALEVSVAEKKQAAATQDKVIADLTARLDQLSSSEQELLQKLQSLTQEKSVLEQQMPETVRQLATLSRSHSELETMSQSVQSENNRLKDLVETLSKEKAAEEHKMVNLQEVAEQFESELAAVTFDRDSSMTKVSVLESAVAKKDGDIAQLEVLLQRFKDKVATLKASQSKLKADIDAANTHLATMEHDHETTVQALEATEMELEGQLQTKEWEIQGLQTQVVELTAAWTATKDTMAADKQRFEANQLHLEGQIQANELKIQDLLAQLSALTAKWQAVVSTNESLAGEKQRLTTTLEQGEGLVQAKDAQVQALQTQLDHVTAQLNDVAMSKDVLTSEAQLRQQEDMSKLESLERALAQSKADLDAAATDKHDAVARLQQLLDRFKDKVAQLTASEASVTNQLDVVSAALKAKTGAASDLQRQVDTLGSDLEDALHQVDVLRRENAAFSDESVALSAQIVSLTAAQVQSQEQVAELTSSVSDKVNELAKLQALVDRFKEKVAALTSSEAKLMLELTQLHDDKQTLEMTLPEQMEKLASLSRSHGELEVAKKVADDANEQLKAKLAAVELEKATVSAEREVLASQLAAQVATYKDLEASLVQKENQISTLQVLLDRFKDKVAALTKSETSLAQQLTAVRDEKDELEMHLLPATQEKVASLSRSHSELESSSSRIHAENQRLQEALDTLTRDHDDHIRACNARDASMTAERRGLVDQITELESEMNDNHTKRMELQASVSYKEDQVAKLQLLVQRFKEKVSALTKSEDTMTKQVMLLAQEKTALEMSVPDHQAKIASLSRAQAELNDAVQALQTQNAQLTSDLDAFKAQKAQWVATDAAFSADKAALDAKVADLEAQLEASAASREQLDATKEAQDQLTHRLQEELKTLHDELKRAIDERDAWRNQVPEKDHELASLSRSHTDLESSAQSLRRQNDRLTAELERLVSELDTRTEELNDEASRCSEAKAAEVRVAEQLVAAQQQWNVQTTAWQAELVAKEEEISHLQELFNDEVRTLKADEALATDRYDELAQVHMELSRVHDELADKCNMLELQLDNATKELADSDATYKLTCAELNTKLFTLEELLSKKDAVVLDLHASVTTLTANVASLQQLLDEKVALIGQLERLLATRPTTATTSEPLSLPDEYALILSENEQLRLGQENLNTIVGVLKDQLADAQDVPAQGALPSSVASFVQDVSPVLGLQATMSSDRDWSLEDLQSSLQNVQASIHAISASKSTRGRMTTTLDDDDAMMNVGDLDGSTNSNGSSGTWLKAIEEANDLNDKAQTLNQQVHRSRDIGGGEQPVAMVSLFPDGVGKDIMSVVLEIVATFDDKDTDASGHDEGDTAPNQNNIARTLRSAWQFRQRLLRQLVAAMHEVHPLSPSLPREGQVDTWQQDMARSVVVSEAQHHALNHAFLTMHHLLYPAQVANASMDLAKWADYTTSAEFADNLRQYSTRMDALERDSDDVHDVVLPFLAGFTTTDDENENDVQTNDAHPAEATSKRGPLAKGVHRVQEVLDHMSEALATMHTALTNASTAENSTASAIGLPQNPEGWIQYIRSQPFAELVHTHQALSKQLCKALRVLCDTHTNAVSVPTSSATPPLATSNKNPCSTPILKQEVATTATLDVPSRDDDIAGWGEFVSSQAFVNWVASLQGSTHAASTSETQAMCDALQNMHAVLWPREAMQPSMDASDWAAYIHSQPFVDMLRQCAGQGHHKAICAALHKMHLAIATTADVPLSTRSMDLPRWTEYIASDKFDSHLRQYTTRLQDIERESQVLCDELDEMHHHLMAPNRPDDLVDDVPHGRKDMAQWHQYIQTQEFADTMAQYAQRQEALEADSHDLHAKVVPLLIKHVPTSTSTNVDDLVRAFESTQAPSSDEWTRQDAAITTLTETVARLRQLCGLAATTSGSGPPSQMKITPTLSMHTHIEQLDVLVNDLTEVETTLATLPSPPSDLTQLVAMMQRQQGTAVLSSSADENSVSPDDAHVLQLRNILSRLQQYQKKWTDWRRHHQDGTVSEDTMDYATNDDEIEKQAEFHVNASEVLQAMELANECQIAAIHVLETHNRSCVAKTRVEIATKCSVQRAFLRWKHKSAMDSVKKSHADELKSLKDKMKPHATSSDEIEKLKEIQLLQLIRFRKQALAEQAKVRADTRAATTEEMIEVCDESKTSGGRRQQQLSRSQLRQPGYELRRQQRRRDSLSGQSSVGAPTPVKKAVTHERVGFGSGVSRHFTPPPPAHSKSTDPSSTSCLTTIEHWKQQNAKITKHVERTMKR
ncbi:hypothetical protein DYB37_001037 [Aphanomyces astaci]|uniref:Uncharacterized protein n=1 Tax=Aphanomyces astaci TaxID=112090 RepID=A0A418EPH0_APHAT|nr:hypothetical protein DYB37_001037 [Aphanomyces astaci]